MSRGILLDQNRGDHADHHPPADNPVDDESAYNEAGRETAKNDGPYTETDSESCQRTPLLVRLLPDVILTTATSSGGYGTNAGGSSFSPANQSKSLCICNMRLLELYRVSRTKLDMPADSYLHRWHGRKQTRTVQVGITAGTSAKTNVCHKSASNTLKCPPCIIDVLSVRFQNNPSC